MPFQLRPDQAAVAAYRQGYMAVPAVPGAGKTTVLAYLAADLIAEGWTGNGRVLIVTYTNSAVGNFRARIGDFLDQRGFPRHQGYEVRTIHSLAAQIVRERPEALGWADTFTVIDEQRQQALLANLGARWIGRHRGVWESWLKGDLRGSYRDKAENQWAERTIQLFRSLIGTFKARLISPEEALAWTRHLPEESVLKWAADVYLDYQRELAVEGLVDFGDLISGAFQLLQSDEELLALCRQKWTYIFEDEAQDSYRLQELLLRRLAGRWATPEDRASLAPQGVAHRTSGNFVRVGDANQAIMGTFTSAEPDLFRRFCREEGVDLRPLTMASRSSPDIIDLANELVRWTREEHPVRELRDALADQMIQPVPPDFTPSNPRPEGYKIAVRYYDTAEQELAQVAALAARTAKRYPDETVAILLPTNFMVDQVLELIPQHGVEGRKLGGQTTPERMQTIHDLMAVMQFLAVPHEPEYLLGALGHLMKLPHPEAAPWAPVLRQLRPEELFFPLDGSPPFSILFTAYPEARGDLELVGALEKLRAWLPQALIPADELAIILAGDLQLAGEELSIAHHLALRARRLLQESPAFGLTEAVQHLAEELQAMGKFSDALYDRKGFKPAPGVVYVTTNHSAKGLEWDTVFVAALTRAEYPSDLRDKVRSEIWYLAEDLLNPEAVALAELAAVEGRGWDAGSDGDGPGTDLDAGDCGAKLATSSEVAVRSAKLEILGERLRLLYVALTRAKKNLLLSCHQRDRFDKTVHPTLALVCLKPFIEKGGAQ
jgi:DNA helicase-2/ATP-dependent DNA helicase PcrA